MERGLNELMCFLHGVSILPKDEIEEQDCQRQERTYPHRIPTRSDALLVERDYTNNSSPAVATEQDAHGSILIDDTDEEDANDANSDDFHVFSPSRPELRGRYRTANERVAERMDQRSQAALNRLMESFGILAEDAFGPIRVEEQTVFDPNFYTDNTLNRLGSRTMYRFSLPRRWWGPSD